MDLHPDVQTAAAHVRPMYDLGITYFDCARLYWDGRSEEAYGIVLRAFGKTSFSRVTKVGLAITKYKPGDLAAVGCLADSDRIRPRPSSGLAWSSTNGMRFMVPRRAGVQAPLIPHIGWILVVMRLRR